MKKPVSIMLAFCVCLVMKAQDNVIKINTLSNLGLNPKLSYERMLTDNTSLQFTLGLKIPSRIPGLVTTDIEGLSEDARYLGYNAQLEYRIYKKRSNAPDGKYLSPFVMFNRYGFNYKGEFEGFTADLKLYAQNYGLGILFGKQYIFNNNLSLDIFGGFGLMKFIVAGSFTTNDPLVDYASIANDIEESFAGTFLGDKIETKSYTDLVEAKMGLILPTFKFGVLFGFGF